MVPLSSTMHTHDNDVGTAKVEFQNRALVDALLIGLVETVENIAGVEDASVFVGSVAGQIGADLEQRYSEALGVQHVAREQLCNVLVDLENKAGGQFFVIEDRPERIVLGNSRCPLGKSVKGHPSLCMMTSNVLGRMTANAVGYAAVDIEKAIARGHRGCRVVIELSSPELGPETREYFRDDADGA